MSDPLPNVRTPNSAAGSRTGSNGDAKLPAGPLDTSHLAQFLTQSEEPAAVDANASQPSPANGDPETPDAPTNQEEPGEETLPSEETPGGDENPEGETAGESVLSQEEQQLLSGMNADARKHLMEVAEAIASGETTIGQVKRQLKLGRQENEELQRFRTENEQLRQAPPAAANPTLPETVSKLKTPAEIQARTEMAEKAMEAIEDFLDANPQGGEVGGKEYTRAELIAAKRNWQNELKALPKQAAILQSHAQLAQARTEMSAAVKKDFPFYADAEHPDTKAARSLLQRSDLQPYFASMPNADYVALCLAKGHNVLQADLTKRKAGGKPVQTARPGTVPARNPHTAPAAAAKGQLVSGKALLGKVKDTKSFADFVEAGGL